MKTKAILIGGFVIAGIVFGLGYWLTKLYGLDPPYIFLWVGMAFQLALAPIIVIATLIKAAIMHRKNSRQ